MFHVFLLAAILFFDVISEDFPLAQNCPTFDMLFSTSNITKNDIKPFVAISLG